MSMQEWFNEAQGLLVEDPKTGERFSICDLRRVSWEYFIGLTSEGGTLRYVSLDRYDEFISVA